MSTTRKKALIALTAAGALALAACGDGDGNGNGDAGGGGLLEELQDEGTITVGFAGEAPYSYEEDGELTGATVAMHEEVFGALGIDNVEGVLTDWDALIPGLDAGRFDAIAAGMSILPDRCAQASFSDPEFMYTTALMVPEGNPDNLTDIDSVVESGDVQMAAMSGAIEADYADDLGIDAMLVQTPQDGMDALNAGRADVFALTGISLNYMADNNPDAGVEVTESFVQVIDGVEQVGAGGTVFRDEDTDLLDAYNEELASIVEDEETYLSVVGDFGFTAEERPTGELTTEQLCEGDLEDAGGDEANGDDEGAEDDAEGTED